METQQIAEQLIAYCKNGEFEAAQNDLYGNDVTSTELLANQVFEKETMGKDKVLEKIKKFNEVVEESYGYEVSEPIICGNAIAFKLVMDIKVKGQERKKIEEICVYETKDGKIISEQFFM